MAANSEFKLASVDIRATFLQSKTLDWKAYKRCQEAWTYLEIEEGAIWS